MFEPDEFIFTKLAYFFKNRKKKKAQELEHIVQLDQIKPRLTLIARAVTGNNIELYEAEREGGFKDDNFFLPRTIGFFDNREENTNFYLYRVLFLSVQWKLNLNWLPGQHCSLEESRAAAEKNASRINQILFEQFPLTQELHERFHSFFLNNEKKKSVPDLDFLYGKWMKNSIPENVKKDMQASAVDANKNQKDADTILQANPVEEIISVEVDKKQQEDNVVHHQFEKVETADEFGGNWKDFDGDDELDDHSNALDEVQMKYTVRVNDAVHSVYQADFIENTTISESAETDSRGYYIPYDEWEYSKRTYKHQFCKVYPKTLLKSDKDYYYKTIRENNSTLNGLRKMLTTVNNKYQQQRRQTQGEEFDIDAITDLYVDVHSGHTPSEKIYLSKRKKEKDLSILLLLDISLSSDSYAAGNRVIDVEKMVSILFGEILDEFQIDFSIDCFYSNTRNNSSYITIKDFDDDWSRAKYRVGAVEPSGYTRIGAALRHSGAMLDKRDTKNKWVILISDGKPNDYDRYEGKYGVNDVKQALRELNERNINSYALAIEAQAKYYLPQMFGQNHYEILTTPDELLNAMVKLYDKIRYKS